MSPKHSSRRGFTLVELLAAMAVLSLLVLIMAQVISLTGQAININSKNLDAAAQARLVFDRLGADFEGRPKRADLGTIFTKAPAGNSDCLRFYSQVAGYNGKRGMTAVGYRIQTSTKDRMYQLERGAVGTDFTNPNAEIPVLFLPDQLDAANAANTAGNPDSDYEVLASGVFRLEFCYLLASGKLAANNPNTVPTDLTGITGVVIALGVLDAKSLAQLSDPATQLPKLSGALEKVADGEDPISKWDASVTAGLLVDGVPKPVLQNVRFYERTFYVQ